MKRTESGQAASGKTATDITAEISSIQEPWQRMHCVLDLLSIECSKGNAARPNDIRELADAGIAIFPAEIEHHLPCGVLGFSPEVSRPQFEAARRIVTTLGLVRRWSIHTRGDPSAHLEAIEGCLAWIESTLRQFYRDTWQVHVPCVERARAHSSIMTRQQAAGHGAAEVERNLAVTDAITALVRLALHCEKVSKTWQTLQSRRATVPDESGVPDGVFEQLPPEIETNAALREHFAARKRKVSQSMYKWLPVAEACDRMQFEVRRWREALDAARSTLPKLGPWMDDHREPGVKRWTASAQALLRSLGGFINRLTDIDIPSTLDVPEFLAKAESVSQLVRDLRSVEGLPAREQLPIRGSPSSRTPKDDHNAEVRAADLPAVSRKGKPEKPTPAMSIKRAAKFGGLDQRTLLKSMHSGLVRFERCANKKWVFCYDYFPSAKHEAIRTLEPRPRRKS